MITFERSTLDASWAELAAKELETTFAGVKLRARTAFPWGREVHLIDTGGVSWHVRQNR